MLHILFQIFIYPVELLLESIFCFFEKFTGAFWISFCLLALASGIIKQLFFNKKKIILSALGQILFLAGDIIFVFDLSSYKEQLKIGIGIFLFVLFSVFFYIFRFHFLKYIKEPRRFFNIISAVAGTLILLISIILGQFSGTNRIAAILCLFVIGFIPSGLSAFSKKHSFSKLASVKNELLQQNPSLSVLYSLLFLMTFLLGIMIPESVLVSSPMEFVGNTYTPYTLLADNAFLYLGVFPVWGSLLFWIHGNDFRKKYIIVLWISAMVMLLNYCCFGMRNALVSDALRYTGGFGISKWKQILNLMAILVAIVLCLFMYAKNLTSVRFITITLCFAFLALSGTNLIQISNEMEGTSKLKFEEYEPIIPLSENGRNVLILMLDGEVGGNLPLFVTEYPELNQMFDGFTYYPNTISYACCSQMAQPALFGGYEYTPPQFNKRSGETIRAKYDESMRVLPTVFSEQGYHVTLADMTESNETVFSDLEDVTYLRMQGKYMGDDVYYLLEASEASIKHHFCMYSWMKVFPDIIQRFIYDDGEYLKSLSNEGSVHSLLFCENYALLNNLPSFSDIKSDGNNLAILNFEVSHEPCALNIDGYVPDLVSTVEKDSGIRKKPDGSEFILKDEDIIRKYHVDMSSILRVGEYMNYLKKMGVYDNTRIIVVADHGMYFREFDELNINEDFYAGKANPILMVKDFADERESEEGITTSWEFMTNADVPLLVMDGIVENPINPYTNQPMSNIAKYQGPQVITWSSNFDINNNDGYTWNTDDNKWWSVHDNIYEKQNWEFVAEGTVKMGLE